MYFAVSVSSATSVIKSQPLVSCSIWIVSAAHTPLTTLNTLPLSASVTDGNSGSGKSLAVIKPLSFSSWLVFVGKSLAVVNPLSLTSWLVFVGKSLSVINPLSFSSWLVFVGIVSAVPSGSICST